MKDSTGALHDSQINRTAVYISLGLAVALVLGVIVGARYFFQQVALQPVAMTELPSPEADSPECAALVDSLPEKVLGHKRAELAAPAPAGAAAWQSSSTRRITLRCGVEMPLQYTEYTPVSSHNGAEWIRIDDATPGSSMVTWFSADRWPVVAVTTDAEGLGRADTPVDEINVSALPQRDLPRNPAPLSELQPATHSTDGSGANACGGLLAALPESLVEGYKRLPENKVASPQTAVWTQLGHEPIVLRCGVNDPEHYEAGATLQQINGIPWFEDTITATGTTSSTWYALGREVNVAAFVPSGEGNEVITTLTELVEKHVPERKS